MGTEATGTILRGPANPLEPEYFDWEPDGAPVSIHMNLGAMDGIAHDVTEGFGSLPRRSLEVGGLLLGRVTGGPRPGVWIERYQRISCEHRFGPQFILDSEDTAALEEAAGRILENGNTAVVGIYRSHARPGFQLEESDFDLIRRYFSDPSDLILLIRPDGAGELVGQFYAWDPRGSTHAAGGEFPFRGSMVTAAESDGGGLTTNGEPDDTEITSRKGEVPVMRETPPVRDTPIVRPAPGAWEAPAAREAPRRLIPDFDPAPVEPAPSLFGLGGHPSQPRWEPPDDVAEEPGIGDRLKKWWPLAAALLLVGGIGLFVVRPDALDVFKSSPAKTAAVARPIGLYVDTSNPAWRVLWNPNATALHGARSVQLFVREANDQNRIDLSPRDLASGSYQYQPVGNDVTFRLEVVDQAGQVSAESFRLLRTAAPPVPLPPAPAAPAPEKQSPEPLESAKSHSTLPKAIYRAPPVVAAGIRPRINGTVGIDVRVQIDARGHVVSARAMAKQKTGLNQYLAGRAVQAARLWRFEPAHQNGKAIPSTETIHFVFER